MVGHKNHTAEPRIAEAAAHPGVAAFPRALVRSLVDRTKDYLAREVGIEVAQTRLPDDNPDQLSLKHSTAVIRVGGDLCALVAFSFPDELVDVLYKRLTVDIDVPAGAEALYRRDAVAEMANIIIGTCTSQFSTSGGRVPISPPVLLEEAAPIPREKNAVFNRVPLDTQYGSFDINLVGPVDIFDAHLNYLQ